MRVFSTQMNRRNQRSRQWKKFHLYPPFDSSLSFFIEKPRNYLIKNLCEMTWSYNRRFFKWHFLFCIWRFSFWNFSFFFIFFLAFTKRKCSKCLSSSNQRIWNAEFDFYASFHSISVSLCRLKLTHQRFHQKKKKNRQNYFFY